MTEKEKYRIFCKNNNDIPIFSKDWWLDSVTENGKWDVLLNEKNGQITGSFPFYTKKKILNLNILPKFTQKLGPYFLDKENKTNKIVFENFLNKIPRFNYFSQNLHHEYNDIFSNSNFNLNIKIMRTCIIKNITNNEFISKNFSKNRKYDLNKAREYELKINYDLNPDIFFEYHKKNLNKRGLKINYSKSLIKKIFENSYNRKCGRILGVSDKNNFYYALAFLVWDKNYSYLIGLTNDMDKLKTGASSLLIYNCINFLNGKTRNFDFEGSMNKNISNFYRSFGSIEQNYYKISKYNPKILKNLINMFFKLKGT